MPGIAASTSDTWLFGSAPKPVAAPENSLAFEVTWAWTSSPIDDLPVAGRAGDELRGSSVGSHAGVLVAGLG